MSEAEKEALAWLHRWTAMIAGCDDQKHAYTLQAMLAGPRMPEDPSEALFSAMKGAFHAAATFPSAWRRIYAAIRAELMKPPPPKMAWHVSSGMGWVHFDTLDAAMAAVRAEVCDKKRAGAIEWRAVEGEMEVPA